MIFWPNLFSRSWVQSTAARQRLPSCSCQTILSAGLPWFHRAPIVCLKLSLPCDKPCHVWVDAMDWLGSVGEWLSRPRPRQDQAPTRLRDRGMRKLLFGRNLTPDKPTSMAFGQLIEKAKKVFTCPSQDEAGCINNVSVTHCSIEWHTAQVCFCRKMTSDNCILHNTDICKVCDHLHGKYKGWPSGCGNMLNMHEKIGL